MTNSIIVQNETNFNGGNGKTSKKDFAIQLRQAGISFIPIKCDPTKSPTIKQWKPYQERLPTTAEIDSWYDPEAENDMAIVGGKVSGNLCILDFDEKTRRGITEQWKALGRPDLLQRLPWVETPTIGYHAYFKSPDPVPCEKLARTADNKELICVKGEGGYCLAPGKQTYGEYKHIAGPAVADAPTLATMEVAELLEAARSLNEFKGKEANGPVEDRPHGDAITTITIPLADRIALAKDRLDRKPGAQKGRDASGYCFGIAMELVWGFALPEEDATDLLYDWAMRPDIGHEHGGNPWRLHQVRHKIQDAIKTTYQGRIGDKLPKSVADPRLEEIMGDGGPKELFAEKTVSEKTPSTPFDSIDKAVAVDVAKKTNAQTPEFCNLISCKDLFAMDFKVDFLIENILAEKQPCIIGGKMKTLKTCIGLDLVMSIGSGTKFLGKWKTQKRRVAFWTGESGAATIKETAKRICNQKQIGYAESAFLNFNLPKLYNQAHLEAMAKLIEAQRLEVLVIDPLYLSLLDGKTATQSSNLYAMGAAFAPISELGQKLGCTIILIHHYKKTGADDPKNPCDISDLTQSGAAEWARQWILLQRRSPYKDDGRHEMYLRAGGSAGHAGLYGVTIDEGEPFGEWGRKWGVVVQNQKDLIASDLDKKKTEKEEKQRAREVKVLNAIGDNGENKNTLKETTGLRNGDLVDCLASLVDQGVLETVIKVAKNHRETTYWQRVNWDSGTAG